MNQSDSRLDRLKSMLALVEKSAALQQELDSIESQLATLQKSLLDGSKASPKTSSAIMTRATASPGKRIKRGALSEKINALLEVAGEEGATVKDLAEKVGTHYRNISIWFATTGKKNGRIQKIAPAHYKLTA